MKRSYWKNKRVLVTGSSGFVGTHFVERLEKEPIRELLLPGHEDYDFRKKEACAQAVNDVDIVIHLAANVGGIGYNKRSPGSMFYDNILMTTHMIEESRKAGVKKFISIGTVCSYPKFTAVPFREEDLWLGYPEETNAPYGLAKKMSLVQSQAYRDQYGFNSINLLPANMYGPGDKFDPKSSHVIPALIRKFVLAKRRKQKTVTVWGTGKATREFLFVKDAAEAIVLATEKYNRSEPINIGSSYEISIGDLAKKIKKLSKFAGKIVFDTSKPDGQPRRKLDTSKAKRFFGFESKTDFDTGLKETLEWFKKHEI